MLLVLSAPAAAQDAAGTAAAAFNEEQLETIAAPVALYPDGLLMQVFMAATYPLEVVEADRWIQQNKLSGKQLDEALKGKDWDPSVKSLVVFPDVLKRMSENLDWTRDMGDAFLEQQAQLLDAVQRLRDKAYAAGQLKTTEQQVVTVKEDKIIVIESAEPEVIYVPTYSPTVVYGTWPYPTTYYPALYAPPPAGYGALAFATGMVVGAAIWGNCDWGWGHSDCNVNVNNYNNFNRNTNNNFQQINNKKWQHNAEHRKGVNYRDGKTADRFGGSGASNRVSRNDARGRGQGAASAPRAGTRDAPGQRPGQAGGAGPRTSDARGGGSARPSGGASGSSRAKPSGGGMSGSKNASMDRAASNRGKSSRQSASRSSGGGSRSMSGGGRSSGGRSSGGRSGGGRSGGGRGGGGRR
jgi:hypothetical protein